MTLYYEGSDGTTINLMDDCIYAQNPERLASSSWKYTTISGVNGLGRVKTFFKDAQELTLTLGIMADSASDFNTRMYELHRTFDRDVRRLQPGRLWWNGWYKEVFAVETVQDEFDEIFESVDRDVTFISVRPYWTKPIKYSFQAMTYAPGGAHDYDFDYSHDYDVEEVVEAIENDCIDAANFEIVFYGPAINPSVVIGGHSYGVLTELEAGESVTVNSLTKKITLSNTSGATENVFHLRDRDSYIFEKIPEGHCPVLRSKDLQMDVTIYDERGEPTWI